MGDFPQCTTKKEGKQGSLEAPNAQGPENTDIPPVYPFALQAEGQAPKTAAHCGFEAFALYQMDKKAFAGRSGLMEKVDSMKKR